MGQGDRRGLPADRPSGSRMFFAAAAVAAAVAAVDVDVSAGAHLHRG